MSDLHDDARERAIQWLISMAERNLDYWQIQSRLTEDPDTLSAISEDILKTESALRILEDR
jgi:hypothetical protein